MQSLPTGLQIALAVTCVAAINHTMLNLLVVWSLRRKRRSVQLLGNLRGTLSTRWPVVFDSVCFAFTGLALVPVVVFFAMAWSDIEGPWFAYALALSMFSAVSSEVSSSTALSPYLRAPFRMYTHACPSSEQKWGSSSRGPEHSLAN